MKFFALMSRKKSQIISLVSLLVIFGITKGIAFVTPIKLASFIDEIKIYGQFEYTLNWGQTLNGLFLMGLNGAYAYFVIKNQRNSLIKFFHAHFVIINALVILMYLIEISLFSTTYSSVFILAITFSNQVFISTVYKLNGRNNISVVFDTTIYILLFLNLAFLILFGQKFNYSVWISINLIFTLIVTVFYHFPRIKDINMQEYIDNKDNVKKIYQFGGLIVLTGPLLVLVNASTRIYLEYFCSIDVVGIYSVLFRISSIVLIVSRVGIILLFRRMFLAKHEQLDKQFSVLIFLISIAIFIVYNLAPILLEILKQDVLLIIFSENVDFVILIFVQIFLWIISSLFEPIIQREKLMKTFLLSLVISILFILVSLFVISHISTITKSIVLLINCIGIFLLVIQQIRIVKKHAFFYKKTFVSIIISLIVLTTTMIIL